MSEHVSEHSIASIAQFFTMQILDWSVDSTKTILEGRPSRIKRLISRFKTDPERDRQQLKLHFHLFIAYLAVLVVELQTSEYFRPFAQEIVHGVIDLFYEYIEGAGENVHGGPVMDDEFIKDKEERDIVLRHFTSANPALLRDISLPRLRLTAIADMLLEKRLNEYREMWIDDLMRMGQDGFMALMPSRVYQHWSGDNPRSWQCLWFNLLLFSGLNVFSVTLSKVLATMRVKPW